MTNLKVVAIDPDTIYFEGGIRVYSDHRQDCCESHYLSLDDLTMADFEGLEFDLTTHFFNKVEGYGIELLPLKGFPVRIPGYGSNSGHYSSNLTLCIVGGGIDKEYDITECQDY